MKYFINDDTIEEILEKLDAIKVNMYDEFDIATVDYIISELKAVESHSISKFDTPKNSE